MKRCSGCVLLIVGVLSVVGGAAEQFFPYEMPREKPDMPLSEAMERAYTAYSAPTYWWNELQSSMLARETMTILAR